MNDASIIPRKLIIFAIIVPLAAFLGYLLSNPDFGSFLIIGGVVSLLLAPVFLRWHHVLLVASWNLSVTVFFLPGRPPLWMLVGFISLAITGLHCILDKEKRLCGVPSVTWSLVALGLVVLFTMKMTGGLGLRSLGGNVIGGRKYFCILFAIVAYFAMSSQAIPLQKAKAYVAAFFLGGMTPALSSLIYMMGPGMWVLYEVFAVDWAVNQAMEDFDIGSEKIGRVGGLAPAGMAVFFFLLSRYGLRGIFDWTKPWRAVIVLGAIALSMMGGFRSLLLLTVAILAIQFYLEDLHRTRLLPVGLLIGTVLLAAVLPIANKLPRSIQRCLTIFPIDIDPAIRADAKHSTDWRLRMWEVLLPEVPKYLWIGKGCVASPTDYFLALESVRRGFTKDYEFNVINGDYHNGPLSVLIPFGLPGSLAFVWFLIASLRVLIRNYRYGDPSLKIINSFLLAAFLARVPFFLIVFGGLHSDIFIFVGLVGLSVSLNRGMCKVPEPVAREANPVATAPLGLRPARVRP